MQINHLDIIHSTDVMADDYAEKLEEIFSKEQLTEGDLKEARWNLQWLEGLTYTLRHLRIWHGVERDYADYMAEEAKIRELVIKYTKQILNHS